MFIAIEGVIGVGKTTLARLLQPRFNANLLLEAFEENPFLAQFYTDRARYAFQTQVFFLLSRYHQFRQAAQWLATGQPLISDYTFEKDQLFARLNLSGDEWEVYLRLHDALAEKMLLPDLIVYLRADTDCLMRRIALRDRPYERHMEREYIEALNRAYDAQFLGPRQGPPVLVIESGEMDFVQNEADLETIEAAIRRALRLPPYQPELPLASTLPSLTKD
jgi:deoxyguanosine kinase